MAIAHLKKILMALPCLVGLSACMHPKPPAKLPLQPPPHVGMPSVASPSLESQQAAKYYRRIEADNLVRGLMRIDGGGPDVPFDAHQIARNFERVALYTEYKRVGHAFVARQSQSQLKRWETPVRVKLHFGASVPADVQTKDSDFVAKYLRRLQRVTKHPITLTHSETDANFHVIVASIDEQRELGPLLSQINPDMSNQNAHDFAYQSRNIYCSVYAFDSAHNPNTYGRAIALIRSEHPDLMRNSCYHEEIAQGLGLANDSPDARPSIFNDDEEFAYLTTHDEKLLSILYDPRLKPGMTARQARPIVAQLAAEHAPRGGV